MLVLTRQIGEEIIIDGNIRVRIVAVNGSKVRLGITAPPEIAVDRKEVHDRRAGFEASSERAPVSCSSGGSHLDQAWPPIELGVGD
jgi:carbon storage regulator